MKPLLCLNLIFVLISTKIPEIILHGAIHLLNVRCMQIRNVLIKVYLNTATKAIAMDILENIGNHYH